MMKYPFVVYSDKLIKEPDFAGKAFGPLIVIRPSHKDDHGLFVHELYHAKQWAIMFLLCGIFSLASIYDGFSPITIIGFSFFTFLGIVAHPWMYRFIEDYRLICEVDSYRAQAAEYSDDRIPKFAEFISKYYNIDISEHDAEAMLRQ